MLIGARWFWLPSPAPILAACRHLRLLNGQVVDRSELCVRGDFCVALRVLMDPPRDWHVVQACEGRFVVMHSRVGASSSAGANSVNPSPGSQTTRRSSPRVELSCLSLFEFDASRLEQEGGDFANREFEDYVHGTEYIASSRSRTATVC